MSVTDLERAGTDASRLIYLGLETVPILEASPFKSIPWKPCLDLCHLDSLLLTMAGISNVYHNIMVLGSNKFYPTHNVWSALTTSFTFAPHCTDNWRVENVLSQLSDVVPRLTLSMPSTCQLPGGQAIHSPGTCLPGFTMIDLTEYRTPTWTTGGVRAWGAHCCKAYVLP